MSFEVDAEAYQRFMGRYADPLAPLFADLAGVAPGARALDVGCGPGALTAVLVDRLGSDAVVAIDPSPSFVAAARTRLPSVEVRSGAAESLPYDDGAFDVALAQLVVHFLADPLGGLREMARVVTPGGTVAACVWDHAGGRGPLSPFWEAVGRLWPGNRGESQLPGARSGELAGLLTRAGLDRVEETDLTVTVRYPGFEDWWAPYELGVGPAGDFVQGLAGRDRRRLRDACAESLGPGPFEVTASAWAARGSVSR